MMNSPASAAGTVSLFDSRPFFEKALLYGVQHGLLDQAKLDEIAADAPKGMVQIARYFGSEFLRPELERARDRIINLVSLHLEDASGGDVLVAAKILRDNSFLGLSKAGSNLLRALIEMPESTHFGNCNSEVDSVYERDKLARDKLKSWTLESYANYREAVKMRQKILPSVNAGLWMAGHLNMTANTVRESSAEVEAVIRTALLATAAKHSDFPDWSAFEEIIGTLRRRKLTAVVSALKAPKELPDEYMNVVEDVRHSVISHLPKLLNLGVSIGKLLGRDSPDAPLLGKYFWIVDIVKEVNSYDRGCSARWDKLTQGHVDDGTLLTLFVCVAAGSAPKTLLTDKSAAALIRKMRKTGFHPELTTEFICNHAPEQHQDDYARLWQDFVAEAQATLLSDHDGKLSDALSLMRRECNVA